MPENQPSVTDPTNPIFTAEQNAQLLEIRRQTMEIEREFEQRHAKLELEIAAAAEAFRGLDEDDILGYQTAIDSYETFCMHHGLLAWPATTLTLEEWSANRIYGSNLPRQGQIKPEKVLIYLQGLRSYHIDHGFSLDVFEAPRLARIIEGGRRLFPQSKSKRFPITKDILQKITSQPPTSTEDHNLDTAFKLSWAGFLRLGEITYTHAELNKPTFASTRVTRSDISFAENDLYATLRLKRSKTDTERTGVQIVLAATGEPTCPVASLRCLFSVDPQPPNAPLFRLSSGSFDRQSVILILRQRLTQAGISEAGFSGISFRKGGAQHASDHGMLDEHIQRLGRWTSRTFQLYYNTPLEELLYQSKRFQTGIPPALPFP